MTPSNAYPEVEGTFVATINGVANFKADTVYLKVDEWLTIVGVDELSASPLRIIDMRLAPDIPNDRHEYPSEYIHSLQLGTNTAPAHYLIDHAYVKVDFDREKNHYAGKLEIKATDLFSSNTLKVAAKFDLSPGTIAHHKHTE